MNVHVCTYLEVDKADKILNEHNLWTKKESKRWLTSPEWFSQSKFQCYHPCHEAVI